MKTVIPSLLIALALHATCALAEQQTLNVDPGSSTIEFNLGDVLHSVHGTFHVQSGEVEFDRGDTKMSGSILVSAASGNSGNESRDHKMSKDVLNAPKFPDVSFAPHSYQGTIAPTGDSTVQVTGTLTLHGTPHEMTVPMQIHIDGPNCTAKTEFVVPYVKWGLKDPSTFILRVAKEVKVNVTLVGRLSS